MDSVHAEAEVVRDVFSRHAVDELVDDQAAARRELRQRAGGGVGHACFVQQRHFV